MLKHLYECDDAFDNGRDGNRMLHDVRVYGLAEKYLLPTLRAAAVSEFKEFISVLDTKESDVWTNSFFTKHDDFNYDHFIAAASAVYTDLQDRDSPMRKAVLDVIKTGGAMLFGQQDNHYYPQFLKLIKEVPSFAIDVGSTLALHAHQLEFSLKEAQANSKRPSSELRGWGG